ncbi:MAG: AAA family ATPase [Thiobacillus sp.]|nr:AAA family ATPase [Thiobacillus sp.]
MSSTLPPLVANLLGQFPGATLVETHISWVLLAGEFAFKLKKPLDLGFLDFSTLEKRQRCCNDEIRLNSRLAPAIYLEAIPITGSVARPAIGGSGPVLEWAVKMRAFPQNATLDLEERVTPEQIDAIADRIAAFHQTIAQAPTNSHHGRPDQIREPIRQNFLQLRTLLPSEKLLDLLAPLEIWARTEGNRLEAHFQARKAQGFIRECHGDLHLGNIAWVNQAPLIFDGIEFNPDLRFIDVISEMAFLVMDLQHRGEPGLAWRVLNRYLEHTGDYEGLAALPYYMVYRALVRAKVAAIRTRQAGGDLGECLVYLALAARLVERPSPSLILMHGVSGSGKTLLSQQLLEGLGAVRLRSDVERKRLFGLKPLEDSLGIPGGIYTQEAGERTRNRLLDLARGLLEEEFSVIVDATFLARDWRQPFQAMAAELGVSRLFVSPQTPLEVLRQRVRQRKIQGLDASEADTAVLEAQWAGQEPLEPEELQHTLAPEADWDMDTLVERARSLLTSPDIPVATP